MRNLILLFFLPSGEHLLASIVFHTNGTAGFFNKVRRANLFAVNQRQHKSITSPGSKLFQNIKGQTETPRTVSVEESNVRVQPHPLQLLPRTSLPVWSDYVHPLCADVPPTHICS